MSDRFRVHGFPFAYTVGDLVWSEVPESKQGVVRTVLEIRPNRTCRSGWRVRVDGGPPCSRCGQHQAGPVYLDAALIHPLGERFEQGAGI